MILVPLLVSLVAQSIAQCDYYSPPCPSPPSQCDLNTNSMYPTTYVTIVPRIGNSSQLDNVCHTFFRNKDQNCTFVAYYSLVYCDGSRTLLTFIVTSTSETSFSFVSPTCSFSEKYLNDGKDEMIIARRVDSGDCSLILPLVVGYVCPYSGTTSDLPRIKQFLNSKGNGCTDLRVLPRNLPYQCVNSQTSTNTGSGPCGEDSSADSIPYYPNYSYNSPSYPPYSYNPSPSGCGCGCNN